MTGAIIKRNPETALAVERILDLPKSGQWTDIEVEFGHDKFATARVTLILTREQAVELAQVMTPLGGLPKVGTPTAEAPRAYVGTCKDVKPHGEHFMFWKDDVQQWCVGVEVTTALDDLPGGRPHLCVVESPAVYASGDAQCMICGKRVTELGISRLKQFRFATPDEMMFNAADFDTPDEPMVCMRCDERLHPDTLEEANSMARDHWATAHGGSTDTMST